MTLTSSDLIARRSALGRGLVADRFADIQIAALGLSRMRALMDRLGNPQLSYPAIHIAGSKGKGTTAHISAALLTAHGYRSGRYTSPHLHRWHERIAVGNQPIDEASFARVLSLVDQEMTQLEREHPELGECNAFEFLTAAAFVHFAESNVEFAVVEVGLGGRFDSTNVVRPIVAVITRIEREHVDILGPGLRDIAWNKAGIISIQTPVVVARQDLDPLDVIERESGELGAQVYLEGRDWHVSIDERAPVFRFRDIVIDDLAIGLPGRHNVSNAGAALCTVSLAMHPRPLNPAICRHVLGAIRIPGRFERIPIGVERSDWILDVAHTRESIAALLDTAQRDLHLSPSAVMLALLVDKPADDIVETIAGRIDLLILPELDHPRAIPATTLAEIAARFGLQTSTTLDIESAVDLAIALSRPVIVTGSFSLVSHVQALVAGFRAAP